MPTIQAAPVSPPRPRNRIPTPRRIREAPKPSGTPPNFTFGWELEACRVATGYYPEIAACHDGSVNGDGMEYKIKPEHVRDAPRSLAALRALTMDPHIQTDKSCGFHVHVGIPTASRHADKWAECFVALAREVEEAVFRSVPLTRRENEYCRKWSRSLAGIKEREYHASKYDNSPYRYQWVNIVEMFRRGGIRTVEVRLMGDSKNYLYLMAWSSFCRLMAQSAWRLMSDFSRIRLESEDLKIWAKKIEGAFVARYESRIELVQSIAHVSGFASNRFFRPLDRLLSAERMANRIGGMCLTVDDVRSFRIGDRIQSPIGYIQMGSIIRVTKMPEDGEGCLRVGQTFAIMNLDILMGEICPRIRINQDLPRWRIQWKNIELVEEL